MIFEKGKTHLHKSMYLYTYICFEWVMARGTVQEERFSTELLHFEGNKDMINSSPKIKKRILHLYTELDQMKFGEK